jgi:hypothetical protein
MILSFILLISCPDSLKLLMLENEKRIQESRELIDLFHRGNLREYNALHSY